MIRRVYHSPECKRANEEAQRLESQIDELSKKAVSHKVTDKAIERDEFQTREHLAGLRKLVHEGLIFKRDEKSTEIEIRRLSEKLKETEEKRAENAKALAAVQSEIADSRKALDIYGVTEIYEPDKPEVIVHDAMPRPLSRIEPGSSPDKESKEIHQRIGDGGPSFITSKG